MHFNFQNWLSSNSLRALAPSDLQVKPKTDADASECCLWLLASNRHSMQTSRVV